MASNVGSSTTWGMSNGPKIATYIHRSQVGTFLADSNDLLFVSTVGDNLADELRDRGRHRRSCGTLRRWQELASHRRTRHACLRVSCNSVGRVACSVTIKGLLTQLLSSPPIGRSLSLFV